jgi:hypothetical protein
LGAQYRQIVAERTTVKTKESETRKAYKTVKDEQKRTKKVLDEADENLRDASMLRMRNAETLWNGSGTPTDFRWHCPNLGCSEWSTDPGTRSCSGRCVLVETLQFAHGGEAVETRGGFTSSAASTARVAELQFGHGGEAVETGRVEAAGEPHPGASIRPRR